jgi:hypothetical protein|nr:MAG TPA: hypothetical protein [Caudoviricetes sp.]
MKHLAELVRHLEKNRNLEVGDKFLIRGRETIIRLRDKTSNTVTEHLVDNYGFRLDAIISRLLPFASNKAQETAGPLLKEIEKQRSERVINRNEWMVLVGSKTK